MTNDDLVSEIVARVLNQLDDGRAPDSIPVEVSGRHLHLSRNHADALFGPGYNLTPRRPLSQPDQFLAEERVRIVGPSGVFANVAILGPIRDETQIEISAGDARVLGVQAPVRLSGDLRGAADLALSLGTKMIHAPASAIIARNHIHMTPADATRFRVRDGQEVAVRVVGERSLTFEKVPIRVRPDFGLAMHIDFDEANACLCGDKATGMVLPEAANRPPVCRASSEPPGTLPAATPSASQNQAAKCVRRIITAERAKLLTASEKRIELPRNTIVTPLARDVFKSAGTEIVLR